MSNKKKWSNKKNGQIKNPEDPKQATPDRAIHIVRVGAARIHHHALLHSQHVSR